MLPGLTPIRVLALVVALLGAFCVYWLLHNRAGLDYILAVLAGLLTLKIGIMAARRLPY